MPTRYLRSPDGGFVTYSGGGGSSELEERVGKVEKAIGDKLDKSGGTLGGKFVIPTADKTAGFVNSEDMKIFGYGPDNFRMGDPNKPLELRGSGTNPVYGSKKILLEGDSIGSGLNIRDVLDGEVFILSTDNAEEDSGGGGAENLDIPSENLVAYYDMRTPLTQDNIITDLSGNGNHIQFHPNNGYYENGKMYRGDKYSSGWGKVDANLNITGGAENIDYGSAVTVLATIKNPLSSLAGSTPVCMLGSSEQFTNLTVYKKNLIVYQSAGFNSAGGKTPITANTIQTVAFSAAIGGNENVYIDGVLKNTNAATNLNLGSSFYPLTGYGSNGDTGQEIYNIAIYNRELSATEIAAISATLLANAGGAT